MDAQFVIITTTLEEREEAEALARELVERRLAACVQMWPITSVYRWKGETERTVEILLAAKTASARAEELVGFISQHHPYEVPEILVTPVIGGGAPYLRWIEKETTLKPPSE